MKTNTRVINYIAALAKLKFSEEEAEKFADEFKQILAHFNNLDTVDLTQLDIDPHELRTPLREDVLKPFENREELFSNARDLKDGHIIIPKVME